MKKGKLSLIDLRFTISGVILSVIAVVMLFLAKVTTIWDGRFAVLLVGLILFFSSLPYLRKKK